MDERVIEAAAKAVCTHDGSNWDEVNDEIRAMCRDDAIAAVKAADAARAPEIIVAVERLLNAVADGNDAADNAISPYELWPYKQAVSDARRDLLAIVGINDGEAVTEGETP